MTEGVVICLSLYMVIMTVVKTDDAKQAERHTHVFLSNVRTKRTMLTFLNMF